jgi:hypothetical protein
MKWHRMVRYFRFLALFLLLVSLGTGTVFAQTPNWSTHDGWVLKKGQKFFAVGIQGIPGYMFKGDKNDSTVYRDTARVFNLIYMESGRIKPYMSGSYNPGTVTMAGTGLFYWMFNDTDDGGFNRYGHNIFGSAFTLDGAQYVNPYKMVQLRNLGGEYTSRYMSMIKDYMDGQYGFGNIIPESDRIYMMPDEADDGKSGWVWAPETLKKYYDAIKPYENGKLVFLGLGGVAGSRYLYENKNYCSYRFPFPYSVPDPLKLDMDLFMYAWNDSSRTGIRVNDNKPYDPKTPDSVYEIDNSRRTPFDVLRKYFHDNALFVSGAYRDVADVIGLNSYRIFTLYPEVAGEVVDAIKEGCGPGKPVWLYFEASPDKNVYEGVSESDIPKLLKCQVYTSIVHGATGVIFWTWGYESYRDWTKRGALTHVDSSFYARTVKPLARELRKNSSVFEGSLVNKGVIGAIHYARFLVAGENADTKYIVAVNTSKTQTGEFRLEGSPEFALAPFEVRIELLPIANK